MNEILTLIQRTVGVDEYGDPVTTETTRDVFAELRSIGQKEFYQAHATGLHPECKFVLADYLDYNDETLVEYNGQRFRVLRTYRDGQELELVVYREVNPA
jgi:SPP1 family predicted phage head-tail adaptor